MRNEGDEKENRALLGVIQKLLFSTFSLPTREGSFMISITNDSISLHLSFVELHERSPARERVETIFKLPPIFSLSLSLNLFLSLSIYLSLSLLSSFSLSLSLFLSLSLYLSVSFSLILCLSLSHSLSLSL